MKYHFIKHFKTITRHRHEVIKNGFHMGIFFHTLKHDLSKYGPLEFITSSKYYMGTSSPVNEERLHNDYYSSICQHHTRRNKHHWEYWTDFYFGRILGRAMPYKYAVEYVCDVIAASKVYGGKNYKMSDPYNYFTARLDRYYLNSGTKEFISACLKEYSLNGFKNLKKKNTLPLYNKISASHDVVEIFDRLEVSSKLPDKK